MLDGQGGRLSDFVLQRSLHRLLLYLYAIMGYHIEHFTSSSYGHELLAARPLALRSYPPSYNHN